MRANTSFARVNQFIHGAVRQFEGSPSLWKKYLTSNFKDVLASADAEEILDYYGTHVSVAANVGGLATYDCTMSSSEVATETQVKATAEAKYLMVSGSASVSAQQKEKARRASGSTSVHTVGGDASIMQGTDQDRFERWAKSVEAAPQFLGFAESGLVPIWELIEDSDLQFSVRIALLERLAANPVVDFFVSEGSAAAHPSQSVSVPDEYKMVGGGALDNWSGYGNMLTASYPREDRTWTASGKDQHVGSPAQHDRVHDRHP